MNRYARIARGYWTTYLPARTSALPDPEAFLADLGEEIQEMVLSMEDDLAGPDIPGEESWRRSAGYATAACGPKRWRSPKWSTAKPRNPAPSTWSRRGSEYPA